VNDPELLEHVQGLSHLDDECAKDSLVPGEHLIELEMLDFEHALTLIELSLYLTEAFAQTSGSSFIHQPNIFAILNLINKAGYGLHARIFCLVESRASGEVLILVSRTPFLDFQREEQIACFDLDLG